VRACIITIYIFLGACREKAAHQAKSTSFVCVLAGVCLGSRKNQQTTLLFSATQAISVNNRGESFSFESRSDCKANSFLEE